MVGLTSKEYDEILARVEKLKHFNIYPNRNTLLQDIAASYKSAYQWMISFINNKDDHHQLESQREYASERYNYLLNIVNDLENAKKPSKLIAEDPWLILELQQTPGGNYHLKSHLMGEYRAAIYLHNMGGTSESANVEKHETEIRRYIMELKRTNHAKN